MSLSQDLVAAIGKYNALKCDACGWVRPMSDHSKSSFFADGWPKCCGYTMRLHVQRLAKPPRERARLDEDGSKFLCMDCGLSTNRTRGNPYPPLRHKRNCASKKRP